MFLNEQKYGLVWMECMKNKNALLSWNMRCIMRTITTVYVAETHSFIRSRIDTNIIYTYKMVEDATKIQSLCTQCWFHRQANGLHYSWMLPKHRPHIFDGSLIHWFRQSGHLLVQAVEHIELLIKSVEQREIYIISVWAEFIRIKTPVSYCVLLLLQYCVHVCRKNCLTMLNVWDFL